jgi:hypothetical protein
VAESFRRWDWLFRFWDGRCKTATQSEYVAVFGKRIIAASLKQSRLELGLGVTSGLQGQILAMSLIFLSRSPTLMLMAAITN